MIRKWCGVIAYMALVSISSAMSVHAVTRSSHATQAPISTSKNRVIILTDIGADPDDTMSLVRLLAYSNVIDIKGLVATTSTFQKTRVAPESIKKVLDAYRKVRLNLLQHEFGFPSYEALLAKVMRGLSVYGMEGVGEGKDSEGSKLIIAELEAPDPRPLWVSIWGGPNTLAQALWKIRKTFPPEEAEKLYRKLRVYAISDQDDSASWIRKEFPSVFYICSPGSFRHATWLGMSASLPGANNDVVSKDWLAHNIQQGHGPLGAAYPDVAYLMEGDTPSFLSLIPNGLNDPEHPNYGGWGGRYELYLPKFDEPVDWVPMGQNTVRPQPETRPLWTNAEDSYKPMRKKEAPGQSDEKEGVYASPQVTIWRWREEFQNDLAARMCWMTKVYKECNHPPVPALAMPEELSVKEGEEFHLDATGSQDPDGDSLSYYWFQYREAGDYPAAISFSFFAQNLIDLPVTAPHVDSPKTAHIILKVTDKGTPPLTRYKRVIVHLQPK